MSGDESAAVEVFGKVDCVDTLRARSLLEDQGVSYRFLDVIANPEAAKEAERVSGDTRVPVVRFRDGAWLAEPSDEVLAETLASARITGVAARLFDPLTIRGATFRNRIWVSPMCQYACLTLDGVPNDWHLVNAGTYAAGGVGMVMVEATGVSPEGRITAECAGIWNDEQRDGWARVVDFVHAQGALAGMQLAHSGRKGSDYRGFTDAAGRTKPVDEGGWLTSGPSAIAAPGFDAPRALDRAGIEKIIDDFGAAARRSVEAGFDVVEIHAAHGYLLHTFLSPLSNHRNDEYGGSLENRARLLLAVVDRIRGVVPASMPVFVRFSGTDWTKDGWSPEETAQVAAWASERGADFFDISSGGLLRDIFISTSPGYQVPLTEAVRRLGGVRAAAVGRITTPAQAEAILSEGRADAVFLGRELIRDPRFVFRAAVKLGVELDYVPLSFRAASWKVASSV